MMPKKAAYVVVLVLTLHCAAQARNRVYEQGKLLDLSPIYVDMPLSARSVLPPPRLLLVGFDLQIQVGENTYFVKVATCCPPVRQIFEWRIGDPIQFRMDKHKMFVRRSNGKELNARLVRVATGITSPSLSIPSIAAGPAFPLPLDEPSHHKTLPLTIDLLRSEDMCLILFGNV